MDDRAEHLLDLLRHLRDDLDLGHWDPAPAEREFASRALDAAGSLPLDEAIVRSLRPLVPGLGPGEDSRLASAAVSCAVHFRRAPEPEPRVGERFLELLRKITGRPGADGAGAPVRR
ncbi:hypothetical protein CUT44_10690 [Streptomyces carminius]|uniref:Uncharacterized protein n=1 Tax=Streptomyces carminius TaxID=2665496 RepID=A0A2M8M080_9ACTN|nr:hypothetical protein [Streptomyces carminius]PJE97608.1 hypothetical protein CUT44_10690 [Streptomyces carminius]